MESKYVEMRGRISSKGQADQSHPRKMLTCELVEEALSFVHRGPFLGVDGNRDESFVANGARRANSRIITASFRIASALARHQRDRSRFVFSG